MLAPEMCAAHERVGYGKADDRSGLKFSEVTETTSIMRGMLDFYASGDFVSCSFGKNKSADQFRNSAYLALNVKCWSILSYGFAIKIDLHITLARGECAYELTP